MLFEEEGFLKSNVDFNILAISQREIYNRGKYIITKRKENFSQIKDTIENLKLNIILAIQNPPILLNG